MLDLASGSSRHPRLLQFFKQLPHAFTRFLVFGQSVGVLTLFLKNSDC